MTFPYKLGRRAPIHDDRTLKLSAYLPAQLPPPPDTFDFSNGITDWGMLGNDQHGDCTCAAAAHMDMAWSKYTGNPHQFSAQEVLDFYGLVNGGVDDGAAELTVLQTWRKQPLGSTSQIFAYAQVNFHDLQLVRQAASLFGGLYLGVSLPVSAQSQVIWDSLPGRDSSTVPGSWGGHAVPAMAYDPAGLTVITWGATKRMTWSFWQEYVEEAWAIIPMEYELLPAGGVVDFAALSKDLAALGAVNP